MKVYGMMGALPAFNGRKGAPRQVAAAGFGGWAARPMPAQVAPMRPRYTVKRGDTIARIAFRFRTTPQALVMLNPHKATVYRGQWPDWTSLAVGEVLSVPGPRSGRPLAARRRGLAEPPDDDCDPGYEIGPDGSCVFAGAGQPCGNGGVYDSYGQCQNENEAPPPDDSTDPRVNQILGSGILATVQDALNAGVSPAAFCSELTNSERASLSLAASFISLAGVGFAGVTLGISAFVAGQVGALAQACAQYKEDQPEGFPDDQYELKDGDNCNDDGTRVYSAAKGRCVFWKTGESCQRADGAWGFYDDDGNCVYDKDLRPGCPPNPGGRPYEQFFNKAKNPPRWECILCPEGSKVNPDKGDCECEKPGHVLKETDQGLRCVPKEAPGKTVTGGGIIVPGDKPPPDKKTSEKPAPKTSSKWGWAAAAAVGLLGAAAVTWKLTQKK
jgi:hypothetical protein